MNQREFSYEKNIETKLDRNEKLLQSKLTQIADLQYEVELITDASIGIIRNISDYVQCMDLYKMWRDFDPETNRFKPDSEVGRKSRDGLKFIETSCLFKDGKPKNVCFKRISLYGICWELWLHYVKNKKEFIITLPFFKNVNKNNYRDLGYAIMAVDGCSYTTVFKTRILSELKDEVTKFLNGEIEGGQK